MTDLSARDLDAPWFLRAMAAYRSDWGAETQHYGSAEVEYGAEIPEKLTTAAIGYWNNAVSVVPPDAEIVQFGRWEEESPEFTAWLSGKQVVWRDTREQLSESDADALRNVCLRLGMLDTGMYRW